MPFKCSYIKDIIIYNFEHINHILFTFLVASILSILGYSGIFEPIDTMIAQSNTFTRIYSGIPGQKKKDIVVITLEDRIFEEHFKQQSPLDREKLCSIIKQILEKKPRILAIDLDLSPDMASTGGDEELKKLLADTIKSNNGTSIVLITPVPVHTKEMFDIKKDWMKDLCSNGVIFTLPTLHSHHGTVLFFDPAIPTLGVKVAAAQDRSENAPKSLSICKLLSSGSIGPQAYKLFLSQESNANEKINFLFDEDINRIELTHPEQLNYIDSEDIRGKVVFFGAGYGVRDKHSTPRGPMNGVELHAAVASSVEHPVGETSHAMEYTIDVVLGILLAFLFSLIWKKYADNAKKPEKYYASVFYWCAGIAISVVLSFICIIVLLFFHYVWAMNPILFLTSIWVKFLVAKSEAELGDHHETFLRVFCGWNDKGVGKSNVLLLYSILTLKSGVILYGIYIAFFMHH